MLGNAVTILAHGNRRPVLLNALNHGKNKPDANGKQTKPVHAMWMNLLETEDLANYLYSGVDNVMRAQIPGSDGGPFQEAFVALMEALSNRFVVVPDYGEFLMDELRAAEWKETAVMAPALMYPRSYFGLSLEDSGSLYSYEDCWHVPALSHLGTAALTRALLAVDQPRWTINLIPKFESGATWMGEQ
jgi:hypothetical protein